MLLSFDRSAKEAPQQLHEVLELALKQGQLYTAYLAINECLGTASCNVFCSSAMSQQCIVAARSGNATLCRILFDIGLHCGSICGAYASLMYKIVSGTRAAGHHWLWEQLLQSLAPKSMRPRYVDPSVDFKVVQLAMLNNTALPRGLSGNALSWHAPPN
jgi:hypothetical protein